MRKNIVLLTVASALALALVATPAWANVYASRLEQVTADTTSYILNENADNSVTVEVWKVGGGMVYSENLGAQTKGTHNWTWNGTGYSAGDTFKVKVVAADNGYGAWTKISADGTLNNFYLPRGVDVNKDPSSKYFGRIYVSETAGTSGNSATTANGRTVQDGIYLLNADSTDADGQGNTSRTGGITYGTSSSPFRVVAGPENKIYLTDWSDSNSNLVVGDANFNSATPVLDNTGRVASGKCANHGSLSTVYVEGAGASRVVYTMDEDFDAGSDTTKGGIGSILKYAVGDSTGPYTGQPGIQYDDGGWGTFRGSVQNYQNDVVRASDGTWWVMENRSGGATDTLMSLMQVSADGSTVLWKSVPGLAANSLNDPLRGAQGIAYDSVSGMLAVATTLTKIQIFDPNTKTVIATITTTGGTSNRDVAFDAAGNLYLVNSSLERLQVWSPSGGANSFTTESYFTITPEPATILLLALPMAWLRRRRT